MSKQIKLDLDLALVKRTLVQKTFLVKKKVKAPKKIESKKFGRNQITAKILLIIYENVAGYICGLGKCHRDGWASVKDGGQKKNW